MSRSDKIIQNSEKAIDLSRQGIGEVTGGDSFCYLTFVPIGGSRFLLAAVPKGSFPLHSVNAFLYDQQKFDKANKGKQITFDTILHSEQYSKSFPIGELSRESFHQGKVLGEYDSDDDTDYHSFNISFSALNGGWNQAVRMRRINGAWTMATRVITSTGKDINKEKKLFEYLYPGFPVPRDKIDWLH